MAYLGDIRLEDVLDFKFSTVATTGAPTTLAGTPVVSAYVGNSTTQITAGITLSVDFDGVTGLHNVRVAATAANGYTDATNVDLVITTGTVSGTSVVGYVVGSFSIGNRSALMPTTAARKLDVSAGGEAGVDWANVGSPTTTLNLSATTIKTATDVETDTAVIGALGAGLTAIPWNAAWDAEVQSEVADALAADLTEAYRADGAAGSVAELLYEVVAHLGESSISGTTKTIKKVDGSTDAATFTLDSATVPTSITRAS